MHTNDDKCILFPFNADFQAFSYRILPETSRNLSDKRLKLTHVNFTQRDSDAEPMRQLLTSKSLEIHSQSQESYFRGIVSQPIRKKGQNLSFLRAIRQRNVSGPLHPGL